MIVQSGIKTVVYGGENEIKKSANKMEKAAKEMKEAAIAMKVTMEDTDNTAEILKKVAEIVEKTAEVLKKSAGEMEEAAQGEKAARGTEEAVKGMKDYVGYVEKMRHVAERTVTDPDQIKSEMKEFVDKMEKEMKKEAEEEGKVKNILAGLARFIFDNYEKIVSNRGTQEIRTELKEKAMEIQKAFPKAADIMEADAKKMIKDAKNMVKEAEEIFYWAKVATL